MPETQLPIGLHLAQVARAVSRAFGDALAEADGSLPAWLVLASMKSGQAASQRELAAAVGVREATLTHHLTAMEAAGLLTRRRDPANRRVHIVELTEAGEVAYTAMRDAAARFERQIRSGIGDAELAGLRDLLARLAANAAGAGG